MSQMLLGLLVASQLAFAFDKKKWKLYGYTLVDRGSMTFFRGLMSTYTCDELYELRNSPDLTPNQVSLVKRSRLTKECLPREAFLPAGVGLALIVLSFFLYLYGVLTRGIFTFFSVIGAGLVFIPFIWFYASGLGAYIRILDNHR